MYSLEFSGQFKKDLKLMERRGLDMKNIGEVLNYLINDGQVPANYKPHILSGKYNGIWECHINPAGCYCMI